MALHTTQIWDKLETIKLFQAQAIDPPSPYHMKSMRLVYRVTR